MVLLCCRVMPPIPTQGTNAGYRFRLIVWLAMAGSIGFYFVVLRMIPPNAAQENPMLVNILLAAAFGAVALSFPARQWFHTRAATGDSEEARRLSFVVELALCESAALFGLVVWFVAGSPRAYWCLALGLLGDLLHFPTRGGTAR